MKVVSAEDLLIHKLIKLRSDRRRILQDVADMRSVLAARGAELDRSWLERWLVPADRELLDVVASPDDEELLRRLARR